MSDTSVLTHRSVTDLYAELGNQLLQQSDTANAPESAVPLAVQTLVADGLVQDAEAIGARFFHQVNLQAYNLVCGADATDPARKRLDAALSRGADAVAVAVTALLATSPFAALAVVAGPVAAIAVYLFYNAATAELCPLWKQAVGSR